MEGGRGGFGGSAPPGSSMGRGGNWGGRGGAGMGSFNSSAPPQSSLAQAMRLKILVDIRRHRVARRRAARVGARRRKDDRPCLLLPTMPTVE